MIVLHKSNQNSCYVHSTEWRCVLQSRVELCICKTNHLPALCHFIYMMWQVTWIKLTIQRQWQTIICLCILHLNYIIKHFNALLCIYYRHFRVNGIHACVWNIMICFPPLVWQILFQVLLTPVTTTLFTSSFWWDIFSLSTRKSFAVKWFKHKFMEDSLLA